MKFLETKTIFGYEALFPISRITCIYITNKENWEIHICGGEDEEFIECFALMNEDLLNKRFKEIKRLLQVE